MAFVADGADEGRRDGRARSMRGDRDDEGGGGGAATRKSRSARGRARAPPPKAPARRRCSSRAWHGGRRRARGEMLVDVEACETLEEMAERAWDRLLEQKADGGEDASTAAPMRRPPRRGCPTAAPAGDASRPHGRARSHRQPRSDDAAQAATRAHDKQSRPRASRAARQGRADRSGRRRGRRRGALSKKEREGQGGTEKKAAARRGGGRRLAAKEARRPRRPRRRRQRPRRGGGGAGRAGAKKQRDSVAAVAPRDGGGDGGGDGDGDGGGRSAQPGSRSSCAPSRMSGEAGDGDEACAWGGADAAALLRRARRPRRRRRRREELEGRARRVPRAPPTTTTRAALRRRAGARPTASAVGARRRSCLVFLRRDFHCGRRRLRRRGAPPPPPLACSWPRAARPARPDAPFGGGGFDGAATARPRVVARAERARARPAARASRSARGDPTTEPRARVARERRDGRRADDAAASAARARRRLRRRERRRAGGSSRLATPGFVIAESRPRSTARAGPRGARSERRYRARGRRRRGRRARRRAHGRRRLALRARDPSASSRANAGMVAAQRWMRALLVGADSPTASRSPAVAAHGNVLGRAGPRSAARRFGRSPTTTSRASNRTHQRRCLRVSAPASRAHAAPPLSSARRRARTRDCTTGATLARVGAWVADGDDSRARLGARATQSRARRTRAARVWTCARACGACARAGA